jgi:O-antigen ligase
MAQAIGLRLSPARLVVAGGCVLGGAVLGILAGINPAFAILAAIAAAYVLLTFADLSAGLSVFVFLSFLEVLGVGGLAENLTKLLGLVLALSWLALVATRTDATTDLFNAHPFIAFGLIVLVCWSALSSLWAVDSGDAYTAASRLLLNSILYVIVYTAVDSRKVSRRVIIAFVLGAVAAAGYGLAVSPASPDEAGRLASGSLDPNYLAAVLVGGIFLSLGLAAASKRGTGGSLLGLGAAAFCLLALFLTASRGGLIALIFAMLAAVAFGGRWRGFIAVAAVLVAASGYFYFTALAPQSTIDRITEVTQGEAGQQEGRATIWKVGWRMFKAEPVHGVGAGNFPKAALKYVVAPGQAPRSDRLISEPAVAHNTYLGVLAELGLVGGALFFSLIGFSVGAAAVAARRFRKFGDQQMEVLSRALFAAVIGVLAADFFLTAETSKQLWLLLGLGPAMLAVSHKLDGGGKVRT